jgi:3-phenylpropionate/trans-cinnamate dioxygenase ferredoxin component
VTEAAQPDQALRRIDLMGLDEVPEGTMKMAWVDGTDPVIVVHQNGLLGAYQGICTHEYFELDKGFLTGASLTCALHLSRFDLETGDALDPPAEAPLVIYPVEVVDGRVVIEVPEGALPVND